MFRAKLDLGTKLKRAVMQRLVVEHTTVAAQQRLLHLYPHPLNFRAIRRCELKGIGAFRISCFAFNSRQRIRISSLKGQCTAQKETLQAEARRVGRVVCLPDRLDLRPTFQNTVIFRK